MKYSTYLFLLYSVSHYLFILAQNASMTYNIICTEESYLPMGQNILWVREGFSFCLALFTRDPLELFFAKLHLYIINREYLCEKFAFIKLEPLVSCSAT